MDRPLTLGLLIALVTGQWTQCLGVAVFFELLWLDLFPAGTYIPPQRIFSTLLVLSAVLLLDLHTPSEALIPLLCALPAAGIGTVLEKRLRWRQSVAHETLVEWAEQSDPTPFPSRIVWQSLGKNVMCESSFFLLVAFLVLGLTAGVHPLLSIDHSGLSLTWPHLWLVALIGAVLAVRIRRAYEILIVGAALGIFLAFFLLM